jgi:hypothetical protein
MAGNDQKTIYDGGAARKGLEDAYSISLGEGLQFYKEGKLREARAAAERCLAMPGYENSTSAVKLLQIFCADLPKTGLKAILREDDLGDADILKEISALYEKSVRPKPDTSRPFFAKMWEDAKKRLGDMREKEPPKPDKSLKGSIAVIRKKLFPDKYDNHLYGPVYSADGSREAYGTAVNRECGREYDPFGNIRNRLYDSWYGLLVYDVQTDELIAALRDIGYFISPKLDTKGERILFIDSRQTLSVIDIATEERQDLLKNKTVEYACFLPDDRLLFYLAYDGTAAILDSRTGKEWNRMSFVFEFPGEELKSRMKFYEIEMSDNFFSGMLSRPNRNDGRRVRYFFHWEYEGKRQAQGGI